MTDTTQETYAPGKHPDLPPPALTTGVVGWIRTNLFSSIGNSILSLAALGDPSARAFGRVRVWGTVGFLIMVVGFPRGLEWLQTTRDWSATPGAAWIRRTWWPGLRRESAG